MSRSLDTGSQRLFGYGPNVRREFCGNPNVLLRCVEHVSGSAEALVSSRLIANHMFHRLPPLDKHPALEQCSSRLLVHRKSRLRTWTRRHKILKSGHIW